MPRRRLPPLLAATSLLAACATVDPAAPSAPAGPSSGLAAGPAVAEGLAAPAAGGSEALPDRSLVPVPAASVEVSLKVATSAPQNSPVGLAMEIASKGIAAKSKGRIALVAFHEGAEGDEPSTLGRVRTGQLAFSYISAAGVGAIHKDFEVLNLPGLLPRPSNAAMAAEAVRPELEGRAAAVEFVLLALPGEGAVRWFSKGTTLRRPADLKGQRVQLPNTEFASKVLFATIGGFSPSSRYQAEVLPALGNGGVNVVRTTVLAAQQLQWASKLDRMLVDPAGDNQARGALLASKRSLDALSPDDRAIVVDSFKAGMKFLDERNRTEEALVFERFKATMAVHTASDADSQAWQAAYKTTRDRIVLGKSFDPALVAKAVAASGR